MRAAKLLTLNSAVRSEEEPPPFLFKYIASHLVIERKKFEKLLGGADDKPGKYIILFPRNGIEVPPKELKQ